MLNEKFSMGDRVRHAAKPEWGIGTITKVEHLPMNGKASQRLSIRFPNGGLKTLVSGHTELERVDEAADPFAAGDAHSVKVWDKMDESGWLAPMAKRKVEQAMLSLPADVRDPFNSLQKRLALTLGLYRFGRSSRGLMDWAVAQTGLDDPLTRFTRQELEQRFDRWTFERDNHLAKLLAEVRTAAPGDQSLLNNALKSAPPLAVETVRRLINSR